MKESVPVREDISLLSVSVILAVLLGLTAAAAAGGEKTLAVLFFGMFLIGVLGRIWAYLTVQHLRIRMKAHKTRMFPGDETCLFWQITNRKGLPVLWVDVTLPLPVHGPLRPADGNTVRDEKKDRYCQRCSLIGGWQEAAFETRWKAVHRGICTLEDGRYYTGDGLGITQYCLQAEAGSQKTFAVYPKLVPVRTEFFLKNMWEGDAGGHGAAEDLSVIRLVRPYQYGDGLKQINWRMMARGQGMMVNQYEAISPRAIHFIFDGESWQTCENGQHVLYRRSLEESLEILASLMLRLKEKGMECGFSFPETDRLPSVSLFAGGGAGSSPDGDLTGEILFRMAEYEPKHPVMARGESEIQDSLHTFPSVLQEDVLLHGSHNVGKYYFITYNEESAAASQLLTRMEGRSVEVLTADQLYGMKEGGSLS